jgi:hypothetical protein
VEALDKSAASKILQAMAEAYPDQVDLYLLAMVLGREMATVNAALSELVEAGLAQASAPTQNSSQSQAPCITEAGMAVACGQADGWESAAAVVTRLEAVALRKLLCERVATSGLQPRQRRELRESLDRVTADSLVGAAKIWAYRPVADWLGFIRTLQCPLAP